MTSPSNPLKIFTGSASEKLTEDICDHYGINLGEVVLSRFNDGEMQPNFIESVRGCDIFIVQSTIPPSDNIIELMLMIDAARRASANYITAVIPYFGYARQDRKDKPRVSIGSKLMADIISASGADRVMTMDLHAPQIQGFFNIPVDHLDSSIIFLPYIKDLGLENLILAAPDVGSSNRIREFAKALQLDMVIVDKERRKAGEIASMTLIGDVKDKHVILIDDIIDSGGTLCKAAQLIKDNGAKSIRALCTHPVLSSKSKSNIENSVLEELVVCDTMRIPFKTEKLKVLSVAGLFSKAIRSVHQHGSISSLFNIKEKLKNN